MALSPLAGSAVACLPLTLLVPWQSKTLVSISMENASQQSTCTQRSRNVECAGDVSNACSLLTLMRRNCAGRRPFQLPSQKHLLGSTQAADNVDFRRPHSGAGVQSCCRSVSRSGVARIACGFGVEAVHHSDGTVREWLDAPLHHAAGSSRSALTPASLQFIPISNRSVYLSPVHTEFSEGRSLGRGAVTPRSSQQGGPRP